MGEAEAVIVAAVLITALFRDFMWNIRAVASEIKTHKNNTKEKSHELPGLDKAAGQQRKISDA